jgi:hypothetical protein
VSGVWTIGREREKQHACRYVKAQSQRDLLFPVIDAVHDLNEGFGTLEDFAVTAISALEKGGSTTWNSVDKWIHDVSRLHPQALEIWNTLSDHSKWSVRRSVAGLLYWYIPTSQSDKLFAKLRHDQSSAVRALAVDRYENRAGPKGNILFKMFDAADPASPGFRK